jgi:hypothetical protein
VAAGFFPLHLPSVRLLLRRRYSATEGSAPRFVVFEPVQNLFERRQNWMLSPVCDVEN